MSKEPEKLKLKRELGLINAVSLIAGTMIGSGIFISPQYVMSFVGSPGASLIIWAVCGLVCLLAAFCYAELASTFRESGAEFIYLLKIYGPIPAFFVAFTVLLVIKPSSQAAQSLSISQYVVAPFYPDCTPPKLVVKCFAAVCILLVATVNSLNVRMAMRIQVIFLVAKVVALIVIVVGGIVTMAQSGAGSLSHPDISFEGTNLGISPIGMALYQGLWSYSGWSNLNVVIEEVKKPEVNLTRALMIAIPMVMILYLLVNVSYLAVMTPREMISSSAVAVTWGNKVLGKWGWLMSVAAAVSSFGSLNGSCFGGGRICFAAAREGHMPSILAMLHVRHLTPAPAFIFTTIISFILLIPADFKTIINFFSFTTWIFYGITISGLLFLKINRPNLPSSYKVPIVIPILVLLASVFLVLAPIIDNPQIEYLYVILFISSGTLIYVPFIHFKLCPSLLNKLTIFLQLFLEVRRSQKLDSVHLDITFCGRNVSSLIYVTSSVSAHWKTSPNSYAAHCQMTDTSTKHRVSGFKPKNTRRQKLVYPKDQSNIVYAVKCQEDCQELCIGETNQPLTKQMAQHRRAPSSGQDSAVYTHLQASGHSFKDEDIQILEREERWFERGVIFVKRERPSLNRGGGLRVTAHHLTTPLLQPFPKHV